MNKVHCRIKRFVLSLITVCLILFNTSCGLDTVYVIDAPGTVINEPLYSSAFEEDKYFEFITNERAYEGINYLGTDVYYKIYRSSTTMENEKNSIIAASKNDDTGSKASSTLVKDYQPLQATGYNEDVLIPTTGDNKKVYIRLDDVGAFEAKILVDGQNIYGDSGKVLPKRKTPEGTNFNFLSNDQKTIPKSDDPDVKYSGSGTDTEWYICMFAVGVAQDATFTPLYSNVLYLGSAKITVK